MEDWNVEFSYNIRVVADTTEEANEKACKMWDEIMPRRDEMNVEVLNDTDWVAADILRHLRKGVAPDRGRKVGE